MIKSIKNTEHYTWGGQCKGWHLLKSDGLSVIEEKMPPGTSEVLHFHERAQQLFYILDGTARFEIEGETLTVTTRESVFVPPGTRHKISNRSGGDLTFLVISSPKSHGDRIPCEPHEN